MKIIFMGTPDFSVGTLEALIEAEHEIVLVVTQPDKPRGRGKEMQFPPVKEVALRHNIPIFQPKRIRDAECIEVLKEYDADIMVVIAFGQILPKAILDMTPYGCINVHASLLPKYRGAAPIQWAVINGEEQSGVTIMQMDEGLDTGDMILKKAVSLEVKETGGSLHDKLAILGAAACVEVVQLLANKKASFEVQGESQTEYAKMLTKEMGQIDWSKPVKEIERMVRGLNPWPSAYTIWENKVMKIWDAEITNETKSLEAGMITTVEKKGFCVQARDGQLLIKELQIPGKKRMDATAFLRGYKIEVGTKFE